MGPAAHSAVAGSIAYRDGRVYIPLKQNLQLTTKIPEESIGNHGPRKITVFAAKRERL